MHIIETRRVKMFENVIILHAHNCFDYIELGVKQWASEKDFLTLTTVNSFKQSGWQAQPAQNRALF